MRTTETYLLRAITNLHPGSGQADFGIVDKHVQRDPVTNLPIIFASSLKGSLRELLNVAKSQKEEEIFGSDAKAPKLSQGQYRFFDAFLLSLPIRSSKNFYYSAICPALVTDFLSHLEEIQHPSASSWLEKLDPLKNVKENFYTGDNEGEVRMESHRLNHISKLEEAPANLDTAVNHLHNLLNVKRLAILTAAKFQNLAKDLPTIARNHLDNGISDNLWYEEIVPRETRFYCSVSRPDSLTDPLDQALTGSSIGNIIQVGGNATVGYGVCKMTKI